MILKFYVPDLSLLPIACESFGWKKENDKSPLEEEHTLDNDWIIQDVLYIYKDKKIATTS
jgi:hypothetical protein